MVFVTGGTGLLGSHLLYFLAHSESLMALRRERSNVEETRAVFSQYPDGDEMWQRVSWVVGDVLERESLAGSIRKSTIVYHCAAVVSFSGEDQGCLQETNLGGTENVAALCLEYKVRLCYVSSIAALGDASCPGEVIDEETPVIEGRGHSVYSHSKGDAEKIVWRYIAYGLDAVIVCPSIILGAGMWGSSSAQLYLTAAKGIPFYTRGMSGYVDVRDVCEVMIRLAGDVYARGERYVVNGGNYTYGEVFTAIAVVNGVCRPFHYMRPWMTEVAWRLLAAVGRWTGRKPSFTRETARSAHHRSVYSSMKLLALYPDFRFRRLEDTVGWMRQMRMEGDE